MKKSKWLILSLAAIMLFGAGCQSKSALESKDSSQKTEKSSQSSKKSESSSSSSVEESSSSTISSSKSSESESSSTNDSSSLSRIEQLNQQLAGAFSNEKLPQTVPVASGKSLNVSYTGDVRNYTISYFASDQEVAINNNYLNGQTSFVTVQKKTYPSASAAQSTIDYQAPQSGLPAIDLGTGITATKEGAAGSVYINWLEGRWSLVVRASNVNGENGESLAKNTVKWLHTETLPIPDVHGAVDFYVSSDASARMNTIAWSKGSVVYLISAADPMVALQLATSLA
ncbi:hypothetical protein ACFQ4L_05695 [Lapidilactobacillus mulanensis]|uniref:Lipoprotein n=1 Tax=Lapidilactobacillus mulanensis TaxID=2485999 RepID=A0ABW4DLP8_9LACO|nr:hypothetical protein [Lapidilactobacillus mulanensis]